jgi:hypothetical protein
MDKEIILRKFNNMWPLLNERQRRAFAANEALALGFGGISLISEISGLSRVTITKGIKETYKEISDVNQIRRPGAGRPSILTVYPDILDSLERLIEPTARGDPESPLRWTNHSTRKLAEQLGKLKYTISYHKVGELLAFLGYSLRANAKVLEGKQNEDRDAQFNFINESVKKALKLGQPVLSVDTKKKELIGNYKNPGTKWTPKNKPVKVNVYDFPDPSVPKAIPYGIYDIERNNAFVNVGTNHDTATFAVSSIRGWWKFVGRIFYTSPKYILITADGGGSNSYRTHLWKFELQKFSDELNIPIKVCHFPAGTSKWNKVEHRLFSFITTNWKGQPLLDYETVVKLISNTYTKEGLKVVCKLDRRKYETGIKLTQEQIDSIIIQRNKFHGEWNYTICNHKM